jgi:DnaJ-class molecular chaperone
MKRRIVKPAKASAPCPACSGDGHHLIRSKATNDQWVEAKCLDCKGTGKAKP